MAVTWYLLAYQSAWWPAGPLTCHTFQSQCWHPSASHPATYSKLLRLMGFPTPASPCPYNLAISAMMFSFLFLSWASSRFCLPLPFSCALSLSSPGLFSLPYLFSLLLSLPAWRLPDASGCALFHIYSKNLLLTIHGVVIYLVPKPLVFMVGICNMLQVYMGRLGGAKGNGKWYNYITILKIV